MLIHLSLPGEVSAMCITTQAQGWTLLEGTNTNILIYAMIMPNSQQGGDTLRV